MRRFPRDAYEEELRAARRFESAGDLVAAFARLERAHILGQRDTRAHIRAHWEMLRLGWLLEDRREMFGQLSRIVAATLLSRIWVPEGNPGGVRVSAFKRMDVPEDLRRLLNQ